MTHESANVQPIPVNTELEVVTCQATAGGCLSAHVVEHYGDEGRDAKRERILAVAGWQRHAGRWICAHHVRSTHKPRRLVDTATAALVVGKAPSTIRRWATKEGRLCAYGTKQRILVDLDELVELCRLLDRKPLLSERSERVKMAK